MTRVDSLAALLQAQREDDITRGLIPASATRPLTTAERRAAVNFVRIDTATEALATDAARILLDARDRWLRRVVDEMGVIARRSGPGAVQARLIEMQLYGAQAHTSTEALINGASRRLAPILRTAATRGIEHLGEEAARQGLILPTIALPDDVLTYAKVMAQAASDETIRKAAAAIAKAELPDVPTLEEIYAALERQLRLVPSRGVATDHARVPVEQSYGRGRLAAADAAPTPEAVYASELRDSNTCISCSAIDGWDYPSLDVARIDYNPTYRLCAGGERCRGTLVLVFGEQV